jgi:AraC-like DNA-binding protein
MNQAAKGEEQRHILRRVSSSLADIVIAQKEPGYTAHRSTCPDGQFWLPIQGVQLVDSSRGFRRQQPFELIYYAPREPAVRKTDTPTIAYGLRLMLSQMNDEERDNSWMQGDLPTWETKRFALNLISCSLDPNTDRFQLDEMVACWVAKPQKTKEESRRANWIQQVVDLLHEDPSLSLTDLSRKVGIAPAYMSAQFARVQGRTISAFRRQVMLEKVLHSASSENLYVSALEAGFYDASHFHRACQSELGLKPAHLRKLISPT